MMRWWSRKKRTSSSLLDRGVFKLPVVSRRGFRLQLIRVGEDCHAKAGFGPLNLESAYQYGRERSTLSYIIITQRLPTVALYKIASASLSVPSYCCSCFSVLVAKWKYSRAIPLVIGCSEVTLL